MAALEASAGLRQAETDPAELNAALVGAAASIMVRRRFSMADRRAITPYVRELILGTDPTALSKCRLAETMIRSELGELELLGDLPPRDETFDIAALILRDLVRSSGLGARQIGELVDESAAAAAAIQQFSKRRRLTGKGLLNRALARRAGRTPEGRHDA